MRIGEWVLYNGKKHRIVKLLAGRLIIQPSHTTVSGDWLTVGRCEVIPVEAVLKGLIFNEIREVK